MKFFNRKAKVEEPKLNYAQFRSKSYAVSNPAAPTEIFQEPAERPDVNIRNKKLEMVALCRSEAERDGYVTGFIRAVQDAVVGIHGITLQSMHADERVRDNIEMQWKQWSRPDNIDKAGRSSLVDIQNIALSSLMTDGEFIAIKHYTLGAGYGMQLQIVDPLLLDVRLNDSYRRSVAYDQDTGRRLADNPIRMGIEMDEYGKPIYYWFRSTKLSRTLETGYSNSDGRYQVVPADRVIHISLNDIGANIRGMPWIANSIALCAARKSYEDSVRLRAHINAKRVAVISGSPDVINPQPTQNADDKAMQDEQQMSALAGQVKETGIAMVRMNDGDQIHDWNSNVPDNNFPPYLKSMLEALSASWGVSYQFVTNDLSKVNFSSGRMGEIRTRNTLMRFRHLIIDKLLEPLFDEWLLLNLMNLRGTQGGVSPMEAMKHKFVGKGFPHIQPKDQAIADQIEIDTMQKSVTELIRESGREPNDVYKEIQADLEKWKDLGITPPAFEPRPDDEEDPDEEEEQDN